jgi:hypothetical protein
MKFQFTFKTPDEVQDTLENTLADNNIDDDLIVDKLKDQLEQWIKWNEYITVEFDSDLNTMIVIERNQ